MKPSKLLLPFLLLLTFSLLSACTSRDKERYYSIMDNLTKIAESYPDFKRGNASIYIPVFPGSVTPEKEQRLQSLFESTRVRPTRVVIGGSEASALTRDLLVRIFYRIKIEGPVGDLRILFVGDQKDFMVIESLAKQIGATLYLHELHKRAKTKQCEGTDCEE